MEEEAFYPALVGRARDDHLAQLFDSHRQAISAFAQLGEIANKGGLSAADVRLGIELVHNTLSYVKVCDGFTTMIPRLSGEVLAETLRSRDRANREQLGLFEWARQLRSDSGPFAGIEPFGANAVRRLRHEQRFG